MVQKYICLDPLEVVKDRQEDGGCCQDKDH